MNDLFKVRRLLSTALSICLLGEPALSAYSPLPAADVENNPAPAASSMEEMAAPATSTISKSDRGARLNTAASTAAIPFPRSLITMDFQDAEIKDVLHTMAVKSGLNIIYGADVTGPVSVHLDRVPFDQAFQTVLTLKNLVALPMGPRIIRVVTSTSLTTEQSQAATFTKVFRLNYANASEVKAPLDAIRSAAGRKGVSSVDAKTNSLIITDTREGLQEVEDLIPSLDRKPQQVDIEAKVVEVTLNNLTAEGISWGFARTAGQNQYGATSQTAGATQGFGTNAQSAPQNVVTVNPPQATAVSAGAISALGGTGVNLFTPDATSALNSVAFSFLHSEAAYMLSAQLTALANQDRVKVLSTPHVVTLNNVEANIEVVNKIPYVVTTTQIGAPTQTSYQIIEAGVKLSVKPIVNADRRITLNVKPEVSVAGASPSNGAPPVVSARDAQTTVLLRDGETIAIGGLIQESTEKLTIGIPLLMNIPLLGYLFKTTTDTKKRDELIVFITPKIAAE
jgi:type IV pilus assembly protein PilQ